MTADRGDTSGPTTPVLAVVGPTASGKSVAAMELGRQDDRVELVAVDAFTVYRGMDIGTAKPSTVDRAAVPHHCIDLLEADEQVDVSWFRDQARAAVADIRQRGRVPVLVGGAGLYFRAVVDDMRFAPTDPNLRRQLEEKWVGREDAAHAHLAELDPTAAARIEPANLRRTVRALEVIQLTGEPFSARGETPHRSIVGPLTVAFLDPPRPVLRERIEARARVMVDGGLLDEARALRERHGTLSPTAAQAIGYAEAFAVLDGVAPADELATAIARRTWAYARRQRSWFSRDPRCTGPATTVGEAVDALRAALPPR